MPKSTGYRYTEEFKAEAVQLARSSLKTLFSRLSLLSSSRSSVLRPSRPPRSICACLIQLRRLWSKMPSS